MDEGERRTTIPIRGPAPELPPAWVTRGLIAACVGTYLAMTASGVSAGDPSARDLFAWGGVSGAAVALDGQWWRLLTGAFLHGGLAHLALNMWCLGNSGPLVERLYGRAAFAGLYLAAGLGGSIASAWWHPMVVGVGASGAIFGVIGGLGAFLLVHRQAIPATVLGPLRVSTLSFVAYNILPGVLVTGIDNAAHLGGLATGFLAGLLLSRPWPLRRPGEGLARQAAGAALLAAGLVAAGLAAAGRIRHDPKVLAVVGDVLGPADRYRAMAAALDPHRLHFNDYQERLNALVDRVRRSPDDPGVRRDLDALTAQAEATRDAVARVSAPDGELDALLQPFAAAVSDLVRALKALGRFLDEPGNRTPIDGPEGFGALRARSNQDAETYQARCREYLTRHGALKGRPQ